MLMRIDLARSLSMYAIMYNLNVEVWKDNERVRENYAVYKDDPDYEEADVIINVKNEITMFSGGYVKIYERDEDGKYKLVKKIKV